ncbi:MAG: ABC transporter substrate-binding protein [Candidatus Bipolaricaulota bacterium]
MKRMLALAVLVMLGAGLVAVGQDTIKLGAVLPLADITGAQGSKAMQLAVDEINAAGGILGRQLELIVIDDENKPEKGAAAIDLLATVHNVDVFIGGMSSGVHLGQIPTLKKYEKVTVWIGAASSLVEQAVVGLDWYFHVHPWDYLQGASYVEGWAAIAEEYPLIQIEKAFWAYEEGAFGTSSFQGSLVAHADWENIGESFKSALLGGGDYRSVLRHAQEEDPDIFIWVGYGADALPIMEQAREIGFTPALFVGSPPGWPADFGESPLANGVVAYGMWAPSIKDVSPVSQHFWDAYIAAFGEEPATYFAPLGYTNVYVVAEAITRAGTLDREPLIEALEATNYVSPLGETLTFSPSNLIEHQGFSKQKILQWQNGAQQVLWPFEYATALPMYPFTGR